MVPGAPLASTVWRPAVLLNITPGTGHCPQQRPVQSQTSLCCGGETPGCGACTASSLGRNVGSRHCYCNFYLFPQLSLSFHSSAYLILPVGFPQPRLFLPMSPCFSLTLFPPSSICLAFSFSLPHLVPSLPTHFSLPLSLYPHERPQLLGGSVNSATPSPICCPKYITYPGPLAQG